MEGNTTWKPNEQGRDAVVNNTNDWRLHHEHDLRKRVLVKIVEKLKRLFPKHSTNQIRDSAFEFEDKIYGMATDKADYMRKILERILMMEKKYRDVQSGSSANGTNTPDPEAQGLNQVQSLPTSLPYTQAPTSQQWLPQNIQSNTNVPGSSGLPTKVPITVSAAQNVNIRMGEGAHLNLLDGFQGQIQGRQELLPQQQQPQQQPQNTNYVLQQKMNQQLLKEKIRCGNLQLPHMQQLVQPPQQQHSLLKQPIQQQLPHQTSLSTIQQSFPQFPRSGLQQNSQLLPTPHFPTQAVCASHQQKTAAPSQEQKQEPDNLISQMVHPDMQQNHLTARQFEGEQQEAFRVSSYLQNNTVSLQGIAQQNNNLRNVHQQRLSSHRNNAAALPSQQQQNMPGGQSGNFIVPGSSVLGTQGEELVQSQPMMYQPQHPIQQQPPNRSLQQHLDSVQNDTQSFQTAGSLRQIQTIIDKQSRPCQLQRVFPANPSTSQDSTGKTINGSGGDWQEETYQKIKSLKDMYLPTLSTMLQKVVVKLRQLDSLPQQKMLYEPIEKLRAGKSTLENVIVFLKVHKSSISEKHRDRFALYEQQVLRLTKGQTMIRRPMPQQQGQFSPQIHQTASQSQIPQVNVSQSLGHNQMNSRLMHSDQNGASSSVSGHTVLQKMMSNSLQTRPKMEPKDENIMSSSGNAVIPSVKQNPQVVHSNISLVQSGMLQHKQSHNHQMQQPLLQRQQPEQHQANQQLQMETSHQTNEMNDVRMRQGINIKAGLLQQHLSSSQRPLLKPMASPAKIQHQSSPQLVDQQNLPKTGTSSQSGGSPFVSPSPVTSFAMSPVPGDPEKPTSIESPASHSYQFQTAAQSPSTSDVAIKSSVDPPLTLPSEPMAERPIDRLIKAFQTSSPESLAESVSEMSSVISMADMIAGSFHSRGRSRAAIAEDLSARTKLRLEARNYMTQGEPNPPKRLKHTFSALPLDITSQTDSYKQFSSLESEVESTASSGSKVNKIEPGFALLQDIREINGSLVETVVNICDEDVYRNEVTSGTVVTCSYSPVALSATLKAHYKSGQLSQIQPLRLLVPANYPYHSPILLEDIAVDACEHMYEDLSTRARSRFSLYVKKLSEPISLKEIAQTWNDCARATMAEYAERHGGGTFSSKYGTWETVLRAS